MTGFRKEAKMNVLDLARMDTTLKKKSFQELEGPCPKCGGKDRFSVQPDRKGKIGGAWMCRKCHDPQSVGWGDLVSYLMEIRGMTFPEAKAFLEGSGQPLEAKDTWKAETRISADALWQKKVRDCVKESSERLWSPEGQVALDYLRARRFSDETITEAELGYSAQLKALVIPWVSGKWYWNIKFRSIDPNIPQKKRYWFIKGGSPNGLYGSSALNQKQPIIIVEGELDALSILQEAEGLIGVVATGSTQSGRAADWEARLATMPIVLVAYDRDEKGDEGANYWLKYFPNAKRWLPEAHDVNDMLRQGKPIDLWVQNALNTYIYQQQKQKDTIIVVEEIEDYSLCYTCLDLDLETRAAKEFDGVMYCEPHLPQNHMPDREVPYLTTPEQVLALATSIGTGTYVLDLETTGLNPRKDKIITIALGTAEQVWIIDIRHFHVAINTIKDSWLEGLHKLFDRKDITWVGHNLKFDWSFLAVQFDIRLQKVYDSMLVEKLIQNGKHASVSLKNTATRYGIEVSKEERNWFVDLDERPEEWNRPLPESQIAYIEQDIKVPYRIIEAQQEQIEKQNLTRVIELENAALPAIAEVEVKGIAVDVERWQAILSAKQSRKAKLQADLKEVLGNALADTEWKQDEGKLFSVRPEPPDVNLASSDQLVKSLAALGVTIADGKAETLEAVKGQHTTVAQILEWKELEKFSTAFGESILRKVEDDSRIHATFEQLGAVSGRIICRAPNLQQIPKSSKEDENLRSCFVAPPDHRLLVADLSNIELRILAEVSGDPTMLRFFAEGKDLHSETARLMFKLGPEVDTKTHLINGVKARDIAKTINFGLAYGMGPSGLSGRVGVDMGTAKKLMDTYFSTYKGVDSYLKRSGRRGVSQGYAESLSGRRRSFPQDEMRDAKKRGEAERAAKNHPIQGTNADILKRALTLLHEQLPSDVHIVLTVHDEVVLEAPIDKEEIATSILKNCMLDACRMFLKKVTIPESDVLVATYWVKG